MEKTSPWTPIQAREGVLLVLLNCASLAPNDLPDLVCRPGRITAVFDALQFENEDAVGDVDVNCKLRLLLAVVCADCGTVIPSVGGYDKT